MIKIKPHTIKETPCPKCGQVLETALLSNYCGADMRTVVVTEAEDDGSSAEYWALSFDSGYFKVNYCHKCGYNLSDRKNSAHCLLCADQKIDLEGSIFKKVNLATLTEISTGVRRKVIVYNDLLDNDEAKYVVSYCPICGKRM